MLELEFMEKRPIGIMRGNIIILFLLLVLFSVLSVYIPHGLVEAHEHSEFEGLFKHFANNNKPESNLKKVLKKIRAAFHKIFRLPQVISSMPVMTTARLSLFNTSLSAGINLHLFSVLCLYFHGGKYKNSKYSDFLY